MNIGELRHDLVFQKPVETRTSTGGVATTYPEKDWLELKAAIWPLKGTEQAEAMKLEGKKMRRVRIRYLSGLTSEIDETWRVYWPNKSIYMTLKPPSDVGERERFIDFMTEEIST